MSLKPIKIADKNILWSSTVKYLRIILDSKITWAPAIDKKTSLAHSTLCKSVESLQMTLFPQEIVNLRLK